jgi:hypothetical protein
MTRKQQLTHYTRIVTQCADSYQNLRAACDKAIDAGAMDINGPLHEAIWNGFEKTIALLDVEGWIHWHIYENDCGQRAHQVALPGKKPKLIRTPKDLAKIICHDLNLPS